MGSASAWRVRVGAATAAGRRVTCFCVCGSGRTRTFACGGAPLGATVPVRTLGGTARVRVPAGSSSGRRLRLRGQGMPGPGGSHGDLYATVQVMVPRRLSGTERELFEQLARTSSFDPRREAR